MPEKYHIETKPVPPRRPRIGKYGIVDWREDCARCHNCVKKACVYDRYREEMEYIRKLDDVDALFFDCMGCFSCVQECTKNLLRLSINPEYEKLGNHYWTPQIIQTTWLQAETAKIPVSGAGYGGKFSGYGFDSMWTDMSEIVRPTRDGIHGREYISTAVDIGRKLSMLQMMNGGITDIPPVISIPLPVIIDMLPENYSSHNLDEVIIETAYRTELIALIDSARWPIELKDAGRYLPHIAFYFRSDSEMLPENVIKRTRFAEVEYSSSYRKRISELKSLNPGIVVAVRVNLDARGIEHSMETANDGLEALHIVADMNGSQTGTDRPQFIKDMVRTIHRRLVGNGIRDNITVIAGGGIALPEHMVKGIICGADLVSVELPMLLALECHLCRECASGKSCPARIDDISFDYGAGRMTNLIAAWHDQMVELMGAMGMRDARRLRGDTGRAMFFEQLEEEIFGKLFGTRKHA
jgi:ferredoxin